MRTYEHKHAHIHCVQTHTHIVVKLSDRPDRLGLDVETWFTFLVVCVYVYERKRDSLRLCASDCVCMLFCPSPCVFVDRAGGIGSH